MSVSSIQQSGSGTHTHCCCLAAKSCPTLWPKGLQHASPPCPFLSLSRSLPKFMSVELLMLPSNLIPCNVETHTHNHRFFFRYFSIIGHYKIFPRWAVVKHLPVNAGDTGNVCSIPGLRRSLRGGNGNALQYSCLENPKDRGAWWATVHGVTKELDLARHVHTW